MPTMDISDLGLRTVRELILLAHYLDMRPSDLIDLLASRRGPSAH